MNPPWQGHFWNPGGRNREDRRRSSSALRARETEKTPPSEACGTARAGFRCWPITLGLFLIETRSWPRPVGDGGQNRNAVSSKSTDLLGPATSLPFPRRIV